MQQKPGIKKLGTNSVTFLNGDEADIDVLLLCTGYHYHFPFLSEECRVQISDGRITPLYKHLIHIDHPTLAFVGILRLISPFLQFDIQVRFFLASLTGNVKLPSKEAMLLDTEADFQRRLAEGLPARHAHVLGPRQWEYHSELADMAGVDRLPAVVQKLFDYVLECRYKNIVDFKKTNYTILNSEIFRKVSNGTSDI
jgi:hypothetical protein